MFRIDDEIANWKFLFFLKRLTKNREMHVKSPFTLYPWYISLFLHTFSPFFSIFPPKGIFFNLLLYHQFLTYFYETRCKIIAWCYVTKVHYSQYVIIRSFADITLTIIKWRNFWYFLEKCVFVLRTHCKESHPSLPIFFQRCWLYKMSQNKFQPNRLKILCVMYGGVFSFFVVHHGTIFRDRKTLQAFVTTPTHMHIHHFHIYIFRHEIHFLKISIFWPMNNY